MNTLDKMKIEVIPNNNNKNGIVFIIYKRSLGTLYLWAELGRLDSIEKVKSFLNAHNLYDNYNCLSIYNLLDKE